MQDIKNVHYVSKDPISNLKVKITLTRISGLRRKPKYGEQFANSAQSQLQDQRTTAQHIADSQAQAAVISANAQIEAAKQVLQQTAQPASQQQNVTHDSVVQEPSYFSNSSRGGPQAAADQQQAGPYFMQQGVASSNGHLPMMSTAAPISAPGPPPSIPQQTGRNFFSGQPIGEADENSSSAWRQQQAVQQQQQAVQSLGQLHLAGSTLQQQQPPFNYGQPQTYSNLTGSSNTSQQQALLHPAAATAADQGSFSGFNQQQQQQYGQQMQQPAALQQYQGLAPGSHPDVHQQYYNPPSGPASAVQQQQQAFFVTAPSHQQGAGYMAGNHNSSLQTPSPHFFNQQQQPMLQQSPNAGVLLQQQVAAGNFINNPQQQSAMPSSQQQFMSNHLSGLYVSQPALQGPTHFNQQLMSQSPAEYQQQQFAASIASGSGAVQPQQDIPQWLLHQDWQQQQAAMMQQLQQQQMQLDPMSGQFVSMGPLMSIMTGAGTASYSMQDPTMLMMQQPPHVLQQPLSVLPVAAGTTMTGYNFVTAGPAGPHDSSQAGGPLQAISTQQAVSNNAQSGLGTLAAPERVTISQVFSWQEKVYSRTEVAAMQAAAKTLAGVASAAAAAAAPQGAGAPGEQAAVEDPWLQQQQVQQKLAAAEDAGAKKYKRYAALGSHQTQESKTAAWNPQLRGSIMFTYVQSDEYCEKEELSKTVTTDETEQEYPLYVKLMGSLKTRQQILNYRTMYLMVDLTDDVNQQSYVEERALVAIKAHPDGAFDMLPGFSKPGYKYRFEDSHGGIYEYTVENASLVEEPTLEKRTSKLQKAVEKRAEEVRRNTLKLDFQPPPINVECFRMLLLMEIMGLADFEQDQLYVDYMIKFDPEYWDLQTAWKQFEPGVLRGVTQISRLIKYPEDTAEDLPGRWVAHLAHPVELELLSRGDVPESKYPAMMMQVCSYDRFNRHTYEGYGWLSLPGAGRASPASAVHYVHTWRPQSTQRDKLQEFFIGGSKEVDDWSYMLQPFGSATPQSKVLNKYGFKTETTGVIKIRLHTLFQQFNPDIEPGSEKNPSSPGRRQLTFKSAAAAVMLAAGGGAGSPGRRNRRDHMSLEAVVARARSRLKDARGGDVVVRPGLLSEVPMIRMDPTPVTIPEGGQVQFKIVASGMEPLRYQWYKDDRRLTAATSDSPTLIIPDVAAIDQGQYHCQVSNKDGAVNSVKAALKVERAGRLPRESQLRMSSIRQQQSPAPAAAAAAGSSSSFSPSGMLKSRNRQARLTALLRQEDGTVKETVTNQQPLSEVVAATSTRGVTTMTQELITVEADRGVLGADNPLAAPEAGSTSSSSSRAPIVMAGGAVAAGGSSEGPSMKSRTAEAEQQQQMAGHHATSAAEQQQQMMAGHHATSAAVVGPPPGLGPSSSSEMNTDVEYYRTNQGSSASLAAMSAVVSGSGFRELPSSSSEGPTSHQPPSAAATSSAVGGGVGSGPTTTAVDAINAAESTTESSSDAGGGGGMMSAQAAALVRQSSNNKQRTRMTTTSSSGGATN